MQQSKEFGVLYPGIERLRKTLIANAGTSKKCTAKVVCESDALLTELVVNSIYDCIVVLEVPNEFGGYRYLRMTYQDVEYPKYSMAARAVAATMAQTIYPSDENAGKSKKDRIEKQRREYILDHWQDFYDGLVTGAQNFAARQDEPAPLCLDEAALEAAVRYQCAVTFCGKNAQCACVQVGSMKPCTFATDRLRETIKAYFRAVGNKLVPSSQWGFEQDKIRARQRDKKALQG